MVTITDSTLSVYYFRRPKFHEHIYKFAIIIHIFFLQLNYWIKYEEMIHCLYVNDSEMFRISRIVEIRMYMEQRLHKMNRDNV